MLDTLTIRILVTRPVRLRGGRSIVVGERAAERAEGGWVVAHPSGIAGAFAHVPAAHADEVERGQRG